MRKEDRGKSTNNIGAQSGYNLSVLFSATTTAIMRLLRRLNPLKGDTRRYCSATLWHIKSIALVDFVMRFAIDSATRFLLARSCRTSWCWVNGCRFLQRYVAIESIEETCNRTCFRDTFNGTCRMSLRAIASSFIYIYFYLYSFQIRINFIPI